MTPNGLATLGVLGTFTGILIGLLNFDVTRIDDSVPELLAGLKIAFTTSIVGIAASILFRLLRTMSPSKGGEGGVSADDIHAVLRDMLDQDREAAKRSSEQQRELRRAISSDGDGSLLTQMQKLRTTVQDGQSELIREFRDFAAHMAENNQKAIIEALRDVIRDFNDKLTEQFGENFKQLNEAVHSLVEWQENYRTHVEAVEARLDDAVGAIEASRTALEAVRGEAETIPITIAPLGPLLEGIDKQHRILDAHLESYSDHIETLASLRDKAVEAFPVIEGNLQTLTKQFATGIQEAVDHSEKALDRSAKTHAALTEEHDGMVRGMNEARERFSSELTRTFEQLSERSTQEFTRHGELIEAAAEDARKAIANTLAESGTRMNDQFEAFDKQMQQELTRAIEAMGRNLAGVSEKFVADYTPLTQRLHDLVNVGRTG